MSMIVKNVSMWGYADAHQVDPRKIIVQLIDCGKCFVPCSLCIREVSAKPLRNDISQTHLFRIQSATTAAISSIPTTPATDTDATIIIGKLSPTVKQKTLPLKFSYAVHKRECS